MVNVGIRKDFSVHRKKTVESFGFVREDISSLAANLGSVKTILDDVNSRINAQHHSDLAVQAKVESINEAIGNAISSTNSLNNNLASLISKSQRTSAKVSGHDSSIKTILKEISKFRILLTKKLNSLSKRDAGMESKLISQKKAIAVLSRKIAGRKVTRRPSARKTIVKKITPKKTITRTTTPKRTVTETVTPTKKKVVEIIRGRNPLI